MHQPYKMAKRTQTIRRALKGLRKCLDLLSSNYKIFFGRKKYFSGDFHVTGDENYQKSICKNYGLKKHN